MSKTVTSACAAFLLIALVSAFAALQAAPQVQKEPNVTLATGHKGDILAVAFSAGGRWLEVLYYADRSVYLWPPTSK